MEKILEDFEEQSHSENFGKEQISLTLEELADRLTRENNPEIIDESVGVEGMAIELAEKLNAYIARLGGKHIELDSHCQHILRNIGAVWGFIELAKKKGLNENYKKRIKDSIETLSKYMSLLFTNKTIEKKELAKGFVRKNEPEGNAKEYVEKIEEIIKKPERRV